MKKVLIVNFTGIGNGITICPILFCMEKSFPNLKYFHIENPILESNFFINNAKLNNYLGLVPKEWRRFEKKYWEEINSFIEREGINLVINLRNEGPKYDIGYYEFKSLNRYLEFWDLDFNIIENRVNQKSLTIDLINLFLDKGVDFREFNPCWLSGYRKKDTKNCVGFYTGASQINKMWPSEKWVKLGNIISNKVSKLFIFSGFSDVEKKEVIIIKERILGPKINLVSDLKLEELPEIIGGLNCLISNDTGILHMASSMGISTVGIYTATNPDVWMPLGCNNCKMFKNDYMNKCPYTKKHCGNCLHYYDLCPVIKEVGDSIQPVDISKYLDYEVFR